MAKMAKNEYLFWLSLLPIGALPVVGWLNHYPQVTVLVWVAVVSTLVDLIIILCLRRGWMTFP